MIEKACCQPLIGNAKQKEVLSKSVISPVRRRHAVEHLRKALIVTGKRASQMIEQPRSTQCYVIKWADMDVVLTKRIIAMNSMDSRQG